MDGSGSPGTGNTRIPGTMNSLSTPTSRASYPFQFNTSILLELMFMLISNTGSTIHVVSYRRDVTGILALGVQHTVPLVL